jgi:hypothetical protein
MKKFLSLFLIFSLMMLSANLYAKERRGAKLRITKKDGQQIRGELITVKPNSFLLLDTWGKDVSINIADIEVIRIEKKSRADIGFLAGGCVGALIGFATYKKPQQTGWGSFDFGPGVNALGGGIVFGLLGLGMGALAGADEIFQIEGMSDLGIFHVLDKLRKKARVRDYR